MAVWTAFLIEPAARLTVTAAPRDHRPRMPPARSTISRNAGAALRIVEGVHSFTRAIEAADLALTSTSTLKDEVTQERRPSQLQPRVGHAERRSLRVLNISEDATAKAGTTGMGPSEYNWFGPSAIVQG